MDAITPKVGLSKAIPTSTPRKRGSLDVGIHFVHRQPTKHRQAPSVVFFGYAAPSIVNTVPDV